MKRLMGNGDRSNFQELITHKAQKMSNHELKKALLEIRQKNSQTPISSLEDINEETEKDLLIEGVYSEELKKRELLEWALKNEI
ncbi:MAG: hypothetical protein ACFFDW_05285 [Candidatus Thorarchaeota archaeon]